jgi:hypothetical protein
MAVSSEDQETLKRLTELFLLSATFVPLPIEVTLLTIPGIMLLHKGFS